MSGEEERKKRRREEKPMISILDIFLFLNLKEEENDGITLIPYLLSPKEKMEINKK